MNIVERIEISSLNFFQDKRGSLEKNKDFQHLPWNSTISKVLKKKLKMSYRTFSSRHPKSIQGGQKQLFLESALIQIQLSQKSIQLIFVDEFNLTWRKYQI